VSLSRIQSRLKNPSIYCSHHQHSHIRTSIFTDPVTDVTSSETPFEFTRHPPRAERRQLSAGATIQGATQDNNLSSCQCTKSCYVSLSDLEATSYQQCNHPPFLQFPGLELAFDFSLLPPSIPWDAEPMLDDNTDAFSFTERELKPSESPADARPLPAMTDFDVPQNHGPSIPSQPHQSSSTSSPYTQESDIATALVCYDCRDRPSFGHRHQYK
jgi:hypothetical protein